MAGLPNERRSYWRLYIAPPVPAVRWPGVSGRGCRREERLTFIRLRLSPKTTSSPFISRPLRPFRPRRPRRPFRHLQKNGSCPHYFPSHYFQKLGFMKVRTVKVCTKTGFGRSREHNNLSFCADFRKYRLREEKLDNLGRFL